VRGVFVRGVGVVSGKFFHSFQTRYKTFRIIDMKSSITPYNASSPMNPWPSLADKAFSLNFSSGQTIFYYDSTPPNSDPPNGGIAPVVLLIHGLGDEADSWRHLIPLLNSAGYRVLALDLPGSGRSAAPGRINLKNHAAAVLRLLEAVKIKPENPVFLVGNSLGALVAEMAAFKKPGLVKGLILLDGSIPAKPIKIGLLALAKLLFSRKWYRAYRTNPEGAWLSLYTYYADLDGMSGADKDFLRERVMARVNSSSQERAFFATQQSLILAFGTGFSGYAQKIRLFRGKIILLWGEKDRIMPLSSAEPFKSLRNDIELRIISGAGHLPQQENPAETAKFITEFVNKAVKAVD
jgi:pimeloyl-ACP methyl ester carboxylesterase